MNQCRAVILVRARRAGRSRRKFALIDTRQCERMTGADHGLCWQHYPKRGKP